MRQIFFAILLLCLFTNTALALTPINEVTIQEAHEHGKLHSRMLLSDFLVPWVSYEEKAVGLNENADRAYLYTPFLLLALDAREKALQDKTPSILETEKILTEYTGFVVISVILHGDIPDFFSGTSVTLTQGPKKFKLYHAVFPDKATKTAWAKPNPSYSAQCYFYFYDKGMDPNKPMVLMMLNNKRERRFYFDLEKIK